MTKKLVIGLLVVAVAAIGVWKFSTSGEPAASSATTPPAASPASAAPDPQPPPAATPETQKPEPAKPKPLPPSNEPLPKERNWQCLGSPNAPIKIEVFSDYQCPACRSFYFDVSRQLMADYTTTGKVCLVYHEFPLRGHQYSRPAARFAEAAARLGQQQWIKVTDALFYYQPQWSTDGQVEATVAKALTQKEMDQVRRMMEDATIDAAIERDIQDGMQRAVRSTPTAFLLSKGKEERIPPGVQYPILRRVLDGQLQGQ